MPLVEGKAIGGLSDNEIEKKIRLKLNDKMMMMMNSEW